DSSSESSDEETDSESDESMELSDDGEGDDVAADPSVYKSRHGGVVYDLRHGSVPEHLRAAKVDGRDTEPAAEWLAEEPPHNATSLRVAKGHFLKVSLKPLFLDPAVQATNTEIRFMDEDGQITIRQVAGNIVFLLDGARPVGPAAAAPAPAGAVALPRSRRRGSRPPGPGLGGGWHRGHNVPLWHAAEARQGLAWVAAGTAATTCCCGTLPRRGAAFGARAPSTAGVEPARRRGCALQGPPCLSLRTPLAALRPPRRARLPSTGEALQASPGCGSRPAARWSCAQRRCRAGRPAPALVRGGRLHRADPLSVTRAAAVEAAQLELGRELVAGFRAGARALVPGGMQQDRVGALLSALHAWGLRPGRAAGGATAQKTGVSLDGGVVVEVGVAVHSGDGGRGRPAGVELRGGGPCVVALVVHVGVVEGVEARAPSPASDEDDVVLHPEELENVKASDCLDAQDVVAALGRPAASTADERRASR
ncbi:unnamed protein product, partial [Prorocentrum cordatum]